MIATDDDWGLQLSVAHHLVKGEAEPVAVAEAVNEGWNTFEIALNPPEIVVSLNGLVVNRFTAADPARVDLGRGFVGLQNHGPEDVVVFRRVEVSPG